MEEHVVLVERTGGVEVKRECEMDREGKARQQHGDRPCRRGFAHFNTSNVRFSTAAKW
jgi:hypothetical protein